MSVINEGSLLEEPVKQEDLSETVAIASDFLN